MKQESTLKHWWEAILPKPKPPPVEHLRFNQALHDFDAAVSDLMKNLEKKKNGS